MIESNNKILKFNDDESEVEIVLRGKVPEKLYKYYALNKRSLDNFKSNKIHFSHPYSLNDIMDGNFQLLNLDKVYEKFIDRTKRTEITLTEFKKFIYQKSNEYYKHIGVFCLTDSYANNLFWPHYTFEQGFSIEFNTKELLNSFENENSKIFPITYEKLKSIDLDKYTIENKVFENGKPKIDTNINLGIYYVLSYKDIIWNYENEWRIVLKKKNLGDLSHPLNIIDDERYLEEINNLNNRNINFKPESIKKVILSNLFFHKNRFCKQFRNNDKETFLFRKNNKQSIEQSKILFSFFLELKNNFDDKLYQIDKHLDSEKNEFISKITYKIKVIELDENKILIERKYCS